MAVIWQRKVNGTRYEVRMAGRTRRLYTNGVFHSQFNPGQPVSGSLWDLLMLPAFFYPREKIRRILVLGVGGGAVIQQFQHFLQPAHMTGVELNPNHLYVARRFFNVRQDNIELVHADAVQWVSEYGREKFDLIIDDLFGEQGGEPVRAVAADAAWFRKLSRLLTKDGILVINFVSGRQLKQSAYFSDETIRTQFKSAFQFTAPQYENAIGVFCKPGLTQRHLYGNLRDIPELSPELKTCRLRYSMRRI
ncbi:MAG: methyltransferase domain-containing protein [Gammaproteobacteria bacterium]|nr:methyltransferase domain-containing protein [Gammaproteobacteria bacterium]